MKALSLLWLCGCGSSGIKAGDDYHPPDFSDHSVDAAASPDASADAAPATTPGLGSTVVSGGVEFHVWAPDALQVFVAGDWNQLSDSADPLAPDGAGNFGGVIPAAAAGQSYQYVVVGAAGTAHKPDPRALQTDAAGKSVIVDRSGFASSPFTPPAVEEMVIYELHVGTFNAGAALPSRFPDVTAKLDYLAQLGVNMIEL